MIDQKTLLFTGGTGLLGREFRKLLPDALYPARSEFNVTDVARMEDYLGKHKITAMFHAAAFTSPPKVDKNPVDAIEANIVGTANVTGLCIRNGIRLIYVSTDYVFQGDTGNYREDDPLHPVNKYAWSKLGGECAVRMHDNSVIIRTSFGPNEFPYEKAFIDQWTSRETVSVIATMMLRVIDSDFRGVVHVGGNRKSVYEYALKSGPEKEIGRLSTSEVAFSVPRDTSLDISLYRKMFDK